MSSAFISNDPSNGPRTFRNKEAADIVALGLQAAEPQFRFVPVPSKRLGAWLLAKQSGHGDFLEWVEE